MEEEGSCRGKAAFTCVCTCVHAHSLEELSQRGLQFVSTNIYLGSGFEFKEVPLMSITDLQRILRLDFIHIASC